MREKDIKFPINIDELLKSKSFKVVYNLSSSPFVRQTRIVCVNEKDYPGEVFIFHYDGIHYFDGYEILENIALDSKK
jgi:hypothetical protein